MPRGLYDTGVSTCILRTLVHSCTELVISKASVTRVGAVAATSCNLRYCHCSNILGKKLKVTTTIASVCALYRRKLRSADWPDS